VGGVGDGERRDDDGGGSGGGLLLLLRVCRTRRSTSSCGTNGGGVDFTNAGPQTIYFCGDRLLLADRCWRSILQVQKLYLH
jgi:hypothetical protein